MRLAPRCTSQSDCTSVGKKTLFSGTACVKYILRYLIYWVTIFLVSYFKNVLKYNKYDKRRTHCNTMGLKPTYK